MIDVCFSHGTHGKLQFIYNTFVTMRILKLIENGVLKIVREYEKENTVYPCYTLSKGVTP